jgi:hypothetical protein
MARGWVYKVTEDRRSAPRFVAEIGKGGRVELREVGRRSAPKPSRSYKLVLKGEQPQSRNRWVTVVKDDPSWDSPGIEDVQREVRKAVAELTPEERARLARVLDRPARLTKGATAEDKLALAGIIEHGGDAKALELERVDGSTTTLEGGDVTRLDLGSVKKAGVNLFAGASAPPEDDGPEVAHLRIPKRRRR